MSYYKITNDITLELFVTLGHYPATQHNHSSLSCSQVFIKARFVNRHRSVNCQGRRFFTVCVRRVFNGMGLLKTVNY